ncbi:MAG: hypothetical protein Ct9H300mP14_02900 [Gammaproteobacteria bacterium]|nr:MAG: hypothetical protein Ct9H300mP14_02900 [Gammaproteobacteria bacterium]
MRGTPIATNRAMGQLIVQNFPTEPKSFEDYVDDDGCGNGPFKLKLTVWREGEGLLRLDGLRSGAWSNQFLPARGDVQDVHWRLHDHGVRSSNSI